MKSVVVVGDSMAGLSAVQTLRREGYADRLTLIGAEGVGPYRRPALTKGFIGGRLPRERLVMSLPASLEVDHRADAAATAVDLEAGLVQTSDGRAHEFEAMVIATGARAAMPQALQGVCGVHTLRTLSGAADILRLLGTAESIAIVGGGLIGIELASTARGLGVDVTLIEWGPQLTERALGGVGAAMLHRGHSAGVDIRLEVGVRAAAADDRGVALQLTDGSEVLADLVVVAAGVRPNTEWLEGSGIALDDGVIADASCRVATGSRIVTAAGDVCRWQHPGYHRLMRFEHWENATSQGAAAARTILGDESPYLELPNYWTEAFGLNVQVRGLVQPDRPLDWELGSAESDSFLAMQRTGGAVTAVIAANSPALFQEHKASVVPFSDRTVRSEGES